MLKPTRVIRFSRLTLLPIGQDIYGEDGGVETHVEYGPYRQFGTAHMPSSIVIQRPREAYQITITVQKVLVNQPLPDEQFELKIPSDYKVQTLPIGAGRTGGRACGGVAGFALFGRSRLVM